jgi:6-phosphogluconolactonase (cycloisomerase 2 family)
MRPGSGPRHIAFHPNAPLAFVVGELDSTVTACRWDGKVGVLTPLWVVSSLPPDFLGETIASAIVVSPDGASVYASNRGQDGVVHLRIDVQTGRLDVIGWTPSEGAIPRFMTLSPHGGRLLVANEQGDSIIAFDITSPGGELVSRGAVLRPPSPSAIAFL